VPNILALRLRVCARKYQAAPPPPSSSVAPEASKMPGQGLPGFAGGFVAAMPALPAALVAVGEAVAVVLAVGEAVDLTGVAVGGADPTVPPPPWLATTWNFRGPTEPVCPKIFTLTDLTAA
jgi:hypothetical protein